MRILLSLFVLLAVMAVLLLVPRDCESKRRYSKYHETEAQKAIQAIKDEELQKAQAAKDYLALADETRALSPSLSLIAYMNSLFFLEELHSEFYSKNASSSNGSDGSGRYLDDLLHIRNDVIPDVRMEGLRKARHNLTELILYQYAIPRSFRFSKSYPFSSFLSDIYSRPQCKTVDKRLFNDLITADAEYGDANAEKYIRRFMKRWEELDQKYPPEEQSYSYKEPEPDPIAISTLEEYPNIVVKKNKDDILQGILSARLESEYATSIIDQNDPKRAKAAGEDINSFSMLLYDSVVKLHDYKGYQEDLGILPIDLIDQLYTAGLYDDADAYAAKLPDNSQPNNNYNKIIWFLRSIALADEKSRNGNYNEAVRILDDVAESLDVSIFSKLPYEYMLKLPESYKKANNFDKGNALLENYVGSDLSFSPDAHNIRMAYCKWLHDNGEFAKAVDIINEICTRSDVNLGYYINEFVIDTLPDVSPEIIVNLIDKIDHPETRLPYLYHLWIEVRRRGMGFDAKSIFGNTVDDILRLKDEYQRVKLLLAVANAYIEDGNTKDARDILIRSQRILGGWLGTYDERDVQYLIFIARGYNRIKDTRKCERLLNLAWKASNGSDKYAKPSQQRLIIRTLRELGLYKQSDAYYAKMQKPAVQRYISEWYIAACLAYVGYPIQALEYVLAWKEDLKFSDIHNARYMALREITDILLVYGLYDETYRALYEQSVSDPLMQGDRMYWPDMDFREGPAVRFAEVGRFDLAFKTMSMMPCDISMQEAVYDIVKCMREQKYELTESDKQCLRSIVHQDPFFIKYPYSEIVNRISK
jgi:hypothetical protein